MKRWKEIKTDEYIKVENEGGPTLGYSENSGISILTEDGYAFKNSSRSGKLEPYEDWRLDDETRAKDLASRLSIEEIAGLMLYSPHQLVPATISFGPYEAPTYGGKPFMESGKHPWDLNDAQEIFVRKDHVRHVLLTLFSDVETAARWNNRLQALAESEPNGIPVNISSDPRHGYDSSKEFNMGGGVSSWPNEIGLGATFDPELVKNFGQIASSEYRALGIATALSPQVDIATEPRWSRINGTFGESSKLNADMGKAYCEGFQTTEGSASGWGKQSVNAMAKHWPGGGTGEGGRDAHYAFGKYNVYPGDNFEEHLKPFTEGVFKLDGKTEYAAAVMPYYSVSHGISEEVGNSYNKYLITDLLRNKYGYQGVVCTDWMITQNNGPEVETFSGKCWGKENESEAQRHYDAIMAGVDQFGGNSDAEPIIEAYKKGCEEHGEDFMRKRFEESAVRLLKNIFHAGLFENPYLDVEESKQIVNQSAYQKYGFEAQMKSIVMLKNMAGALPMEKKKKVYVPLRFTKEMPGWAGADTIPAKTECPINKEVLSTYYEVVDTPEEADFALIKARSPMDANVAGGYSVKDRNNGGNGYVPISLQYRPYTADLARETSIAGGDPLEDFTNRTYRGKTVITQNESDLDMILDTREQMKGKPVIVILSLDRPCVVAEFEKEVDGILVDFGVSDKALCEIISGNVEPSGLLPFQMPADMNTVECQKEDVPFDMNCYVDQQQHTYDFGYGLNFHGVIDDERVKKYAHNKNERSR